MSKTVTHLAYLMPEDPEAYVGDKVKTLCGKKKRVEVPSNKPVCGQCFKVYSDDAARTGAAVEIIMDTIAGLTDVLNNGRRDYIENVGEGIVLSSRPVKVLERVVR